MRHSSRIINIANKTSLAVLTLKPKKKIQVSTGVEPMTTAISVKCPTN